MRENNQQSNLISWLIISILAITWGSSFILIKKSLTFFSSGEVGALRIVISYLFLIPFAIPRLKKISRKDAANLAVAGILGNGIPAFLFATAQTVISSSVAGVLNSLTPLFTVIVGVLAFNIRPRWFNYVGVLLGLAGAAGLILATSRQDFVFHAGYALLIVLATLMYATNANILKVWLRNIEPVGIVSLSFFIIGPPVMGYLFFFTDFPRQLTSDPATLKGLGYLAILSIGGTALALMLFNKLLKMTTPVFASSITYLMPLIALMWGIADGEPLLLSHLVWIFLILSGVILVSSRHPYDFPVVGYFLRKLKNYSGGL